MNPAHLLLKWFDHSGRKLPWRETRDPYAIIVSEIMLQQTQVHRVIPYYEKWLGIYPNWKSLSKASNADIIRLWSGLGYNRRGLALRDIAAQIVERGSEPDSREEWMSLKGIGPYTSAAVSAFAQKKRVLPIDTNIRRVLSRYLLGIPYPDLKIDSQINEKIDDILPKSGRYYDIPQAIFDLATSICTKSPDCDRCPLKDTCPLAQAFMDGEIIAPKRTIKKSNEKIHRDKKYPDRIFRGRILKLVQEEPGIVISSIGKKIDGSYKKELDEKWLVAMIERLIKDTLIDKKGKKLYVHGEAN